MTRSLGALREELDAKGFVLCPSGVGAPALGRLLGACERAADSDRVRHPAGGTYGARGLLWSGPDFRAALDASGMTAWATAALGREAFPIDAIFFDKRPEANWTVPAHQDRVMPVQSAVAGITWLRNGIDYAEPSAETLAALLALRVHFDDVGAEDGPLEVIPGAHRRGLLDEEALRWFGTTPYEPCPAARGDILLMRPLLLHRSRRKLAPGPRRVLHVVYATESPGQGLRWKSHA